MKSTKIPKKIAEKEFEELIQMEQKFANISVKCRKIANKFPLKDIAMKMGNYSVKKLKRMLDKGIAYEAKFEDLQRFLWACKYQMTSSIRKRKL